MASIIHSVTGTHAQKPEFRMKKTEKTEALFVFIHVRQKKLLSLAAFLCGPT